NADIFGERNLDWFSFSDERTIFPSPRLRLSSLVEFLGAIVRLCRNDVSPGVHDHIQNDRLEAIGTTPMRCAQRRNGVKSVLSPIRLGNTDSLGSRGLSQCYAADCGRDGQGGSKEATEHEVHVATIH